jgi:hypothetical protein
MVRQVCDCGSGVDPHDHWIEHAGARPSPIISREGCKLHLGAVYKRNLRRCGEGEVTLQGILHPRWRSVPRFSVDSRKYRQEE